MDIVYADETGKELGFLNNFECDFDFGDTNDFEIRTSIKNNILKDGYFVYVKDTELGGIVNRVKVDTNSNMIYYGGYTWRGRLSKRIVEPWPGNDYFVVSGYLDEAFTDLLEGTYNMFRISHELVEMEIKIDRYQCRRYYSVLDEIVNILDSIGYRLDLKFHDGFCFIYCKKKKDYSDQYEFSEDMNITCKIEKRTDFVNHLICLGQGELKDRWVIHLYADINGNISKIKTQYGTDEFTETYNYSSAESMEELESSGIEEFKNRRLEAALEANIDSSIDLQLGDIVSGKEYITNTQIKKEITQKIVQINDFNIQISYKVGD